VAVRVDTVFETLSERLQGVFSSLRGQGNLSEAQVDAALREIRLALLEADVHFKVVKQFLSQVRARAIGQEVLKSLTPDQAVLRVVRDEMVSLLSAGGGQSAGRLARGRGVPAVVMVTGLQGSGKTTTLAKLGRYLVRASHHPLLVSTDVQRPAAREQLRTLGESSDLKVHQPATNELSAIVASALAQARSVGHDYLLVDTAGRLHVDDALMNELEQLTRLAEPSELLYVADAMTGQDAVRSAAEFGRRIALTGIVLSKLDGDARGGAALSAAAVTGCSVRFAGVGEKVDDFEVFHPTRMVSRILGEGDVLSLIERAESVVDREQAERSFARLKSRTFSLEDFRDQLLQVRKLGPLEQVLKMLPGAGSLRGVDTEAGERDLARSLAIINSMTPGERRQPSVLNGSRRKRIAHGSGTRVEHVNRLLKQYTQTRKMMKGFGNAKMMKRLAAQMPGSLGF
jgi:signal recognition particle subunit SRP54